MCSLESVSAPESYLEVAAACVAESAGSTASSKEEDLHQIVGKFIDVECRFNSHTNSFTSNLDVLRET